MPDKPIWLRLVIFPLLNKEGELDRYVLMHEDITERKKAEQLLVESEEKQRHLLQHLHAGIVVHAADSSILFANDQACQLLGLSPDQVMGKTTIDAAWHFVQEDLTQMSIDQYPVQQVINFKTPLREQVLGINRPELNDLVWVLVNAFPEFHPDGSLLQVVVTFIDIAERRLIENTMSFLLECGLPGKGEGFFESLARYLSGALNMEYVCIDSLEGDGLTAQTLAVYNSGSFDSNVRYALRDTPCGQVADEGICCFTQGIQRLFPNDAALQELKAESYVGTTLTNSKGEAIGLIAVIGHRELVDSRKAKMLLKLVAPRAAGELERRKAEDQILDQLNELRRWNEAMLNREERVLDLKREVNQLLVAEGNPVRYASAVDILPNSEQSNHQDVIE